MKTVNDLLFGEGSPAERILAEALVENQLSGDAVGVSTTLLDSPTIAGAAVDVLDVELSGFIARAWNDYHQVKKAKEKTAKNAPDKEEIGLARHTITTKHPLIVELELAGTPRPVFRYELVLEFEVDPVNLLIMDGNIGPISLQARVKGTLNVGGVKLRSSELHTMRFAITERSSPPDARLPPAPKKGAPQTSIDLRDPIEEHP